MPNKVKSFTLAELLVVMILTAIVVGIAFTVLRLVQQQIHTIKGNFDKSGSLSMFEQKLWQDFSEFDMIYFEQGKKTVWLASETDTITYVFGEEFTLREKDTFQLRLMPDRIFYKGKLVKGGNIDAISVGAGQEFPDYAIFVSRKNDKTLLMNEDGF